MWVLVFCCALKHKGCSDDTCAIITYCHVVLPEAQKPAHQCYFPTELEFISLWSDKYLLRSILRNCWNHQSLIKQSSFFLCLTSSSAFLEVNTADPISSQLYWGNSLGNIILVKKRDFSSFFFFFCAYHFAFDGFCVLPLSILSITVGIV